MGFKRPGAIRHPKGLGLMGLWQGHAFRADISKLGENVKDESAKVEKGKFLYKGNRLYRGTSCIPPVNTRDGASPSATRKKG